MKLLMCSQRNYILHEVEEVVRYYPNLYRGERYLERWAEVQIKGWPRTYQTPARNLVVHG